MGIQVKSENSKSHSEIKQSRLQSTSLVTVVVSPGSLSASTARAIDSFSFSLGMT